MRYVKDDSTGVLLGGVSVDLDREKIRRHRIHRIVRYLLGSLRIYSFISIILLLYILSLNHLA